MLLGLWAIFEEQIAAQRPLHLLLLLFRLIPCGYSYYIGNGVWRLTSEGVWGGVLLGGTNLSAEESFFWPYSVQVWCEAVVIPE
jgi:hypothetical protein